MKLLKYKLQQILNLLQFCKQISSTLTATWKVVDQGRKKGGEWRPFLRELRVETGEMTSNFCLISVRPTSSLKLMINDLSSSAKSYLHFTVPDGIHEVFKPSLPSSFSQKKEKN